MKAWILKLTIVIASIGISACSTQWREASDSGSLDSILEDLKSVSSQSSGSSSSKLNELLEGDYKANTSIYRAEAPGSMGPVASVASLASLAFMGQGDDVNVLDFNKAKVYFVSGYDNQGEQAYVLFLELTKADGGQVVSRSFSNKGDAQVLNDEYVINMEDKLVLSTFDIEDKVEDFKSVIQLSVSDFDDNGEERRIGKFHSLVGYSL